jgi:hypothetical protein
LFSITKGAGEGERERERERGGGRGLCHLSWLWKGATERKKNKKSKECKYDKRWDDKKDEVEKEKSEYSQKTGSPVLLLASKLLQKSCFLPVIFGENVESRM